VGAVVVAVVGWVLLGYLALMPLGAIFGWSGHPALPDAPAAVYVLLYLVVLPALCGFAAWKTIARIERRQRSR
jgi:drug/metabolite transporter (DMT)-like permease